MSGEHNQDPEAEFWATLVPELLVADLSRSIAFYRDLCGFRIRFSRPEDGFAFIVLGKAQIMLEEISEESWLTDRLEPPFGRGINLQIEVPEAESVHQRLLAAGARLFGPIKTEWYREDNWEHGQTQFLVQDPDGYLLRFAQHLGRRLVENST